jgi:hypothetical protein
MPFLFTSISKNYKLDLLVENFTNKIIEVTSNSIPKSTTSLYSKF